MYIKAFKINEVNINLKLLLTKSEAIAVCKRGKHKVRKELLKHIAEQLMDLPDINTNVLEDHIAYPNKVIVNKITSEVSIDETKPADICYGDDK